MQRLSRVLFFCLGFLSWSGLPAFARPSSTPVHLVHNVQLLAANPGETSGLSAEAIVPFHLHRGHMIAVKCSLAGLGEVLAIIDTGASETVLDIELARKLRLDLEPDSATFISRQAKVWAVSIPVLELGPIRADHLQGIAADLSSLTDDLGFRPQVVIGMDVLRRSSFLIDYQSHRLVFFQAPQFQGPAPQLAHQARLLPSVSTQSAAQSVTSDASRRFAVIEASIAGKTVRLQVDSGFEGLLVYGSQLPDRDRAAFGSRSANSFAGGESHLANLGQNLVAHSLAAPLINVQIGEWHAPHPQLTLVDGPAPESAVFDGLIGTAFLSKKKVAFDFQNGIIYWE